MFETKLGRLIRGYARRDAVHLATLPVTAGEEISIGAHIRLELVDTIYYAYNSNPFGEKPSIGIADPWIRLSGIRKGERFNVLLNPGSTTSLVHQWTAPSIDGPDNSLGPKAIAGMWMKDFADEAGLEYRELMAGAKRYLETEEHLCEGGRWEGFSSPPEFWEHYFALEGLNPRDAGNFFSCSCG